MTVDPLAAVRVPPDVVARRLGAGGVLVDLKTNAIFELNDTGMRVWELLADGLVSRDVVRTLIAEFEIDEAAALEACSQLVARLRTEGLIA